MHHFRSPRHQTNAPPRHRSLAEREHLREQERARIAEITSEYPGAFSFPTLTEDPAFLRAFHIAVKGGHELPYGYLKLLPQDFIVEEIPSSGETLTIERKHLEFPPPPLDPIATIYATLVKVNLSTMQAVEEIARALKVTIKDIQYAGIKDRHALTAQRISVRNADPRLLANINHPQFFLKDIAFGKGVVEIGGLTGNRFTIFMRTIGDVDASRFGAHWDTLKEHGFYNFYHLQRFSTPRLINWKWGRAILKGDYETAVKSVLTETNDREFPYVQSARNAMLERWGNWKSMREAIEDFPLLFEPELAMLRYLESRGRDFGGALKTAPEQVTLWVYGYASLLFNRLLETYAKAGEIPPKKFPLLLSPERDDHVRYMPFLEEEGMFPLSFAAIRPFPKIQIRRRMVETMLKAKQHRVELVNGGVVLEFSLPKGAYATTFLTHLFQMISGHPPESINTDPIDTKLVVGGDSIASTLNHFASAISPQGTDPIEE